MLPDPLPSQECLPASLPGAELCRSAGASPTCKNIPIYDFRRASGGRCGHYTGRWWDEGPPAHRAPREGSSRESIHALSQEDLGGDALPPACRQRPLPPSICPLLVPFAGQQRGDGTSRTPRRNGLSWPSRAHRTPRAAWAPRPPGPPGARLRGWICEWSPLQGWGGVGWSRAQTRLRPFSLRLG